MPHIHFTDIHGRRQVLHLSHSPVAIGRDPSCEISFPDKRISRNHSRIVMDGTRWVVEDLQSTNGTFVGEKNIQKHVLQQSDSIKIGPLTLVFKNDQEKEPSVIIDKDEMTFAVSKSMVVHSMEGPKVEQRLEIFLEIAEALDSLGTTQELLARFVDSIKKMFSPDTCIIALGDEYLRQPPLKAGRDVEEIESSIAGVMGRVREKNEGVIFEYASPQKSKKGVQKTIQQACVPIWVSGKLRGVIYLDRIRKPNFASFTRDDLRTLVVLGRLISAAAVSSDKLARLDAENRMMSRQFGKVGTLIGKSKKNAELIELIETKVGPVDSTVLFTGETGTGKTWTAQALHLASKRANGPFVKVNCAAIPDNLIESELFGHEKGSFSGATARKIGLFEAANGGTLLLDEIGELNSGSQAKLLTVLQDKKLSRVGSTQTIDIDVRIVAATNIDLKAAVDSGSFRADLYYRLNIINLEIPPLRARREDILPLAEHFLQRVNGETGKNITGMTPEVASGLEGYSWPGNIRELSNVIERAVIFADCNSPITLQDFPDELFTAPGLKTTTPSKDNEKEMVLSAMNSSGGNKREAARTLGWYPQKLYARLKEYGIE